MMKFKFLYFIMLLSFKMYIRYINVWIDFWSSYIYIDHIWCDFLNLLFWNDISKLIKIFYALQNIEFVQWCSFHWLCRNIYTITLPWFYHDLLFTTVLIFILKSWIFIIILSYIYFFLQSMSFTIFIFIIVL